jgi:hypothetical protein
LGQASQLESTLYLRQRRVDMTQRLRALLPILLPALGAQ